MGLNISNITNLSPEEFISEAHWIAAVPSLIILFFTMIFIFLIVGLWRVKESRGRFMIIWTLSVAISIIVLGFLIFFEQTVQGILNFLF